MISAAADSCCVVVDVAGAGTVVVPQVASGAGDSAESAGLGMEVVSVDTGRAIDSAAALRPTAGVPAAVICVSVVPLSHWVEPMPKPPTTTIDAAVTPIWRRRRRWAARATI